jgi:hypothetical protein
VSKSIDFIKIDLPASVSSVITVKPLGEINRQILNQGVIFYRKRKQHQTLQCNFAFKVSK